MTSQASDGTHSLLENIVIIIAMLVSLIASIALLFLDAPPIIVSILLATFLASLVYGFLGGIEGATLRTGALVLSGTLSALIGSAFLINEQLEEQMKLDLTRDCKPSIESWFAVSRNGGTPVKVEIRGIDGCIEKPEEEVFDTNQLSIEKRNTALSVYTGSGSNFLLGNLGAEELRKIGLFNSLTEKVDNFFTTKRLPAGTTDYKLGPIPFKLSVVSFDENHSKYELYDESDKLIRDKSIYIRQAHIFKQHGTFYIIAVVEVDHTPKEDSDKYAKFMICEIGTDIIS